MLSTNDKTASLQACKLFAEMPLPTLNLLAEAVETECFSPGEIVCRKDEEADRVFFIHQGQIEVYLVGIDKPVNYLSKGDVVGEYGMFRGSRTATLQAKSEVILLSMDYERFRSFLFHYPLAMYSLLRKAVQRLEMAESRFRDHPASGGK